MIRKFSELSSQFTDQLVKKASAEEVRNLNEEKIDISQVKLLVSQHRIGIDSDLEVLKNSFNRLVAEVQQKVSKTELSQQSQELQR
jgi:hypothetical protein